MDKKKEEEKKKNFSPEEIAEEIHEHNKTLYKDIKRKDKDAKDRTTGGF